MRYSIEEMQDAYDEINRKERPLVAFGGALGGALPAAALYFLFAQIGGIFLPMLLMPAAVIGIFARYTGFPYRLKPRIPIGILAMVFHFAGCWLLQLNPFVYLLGPVCAGVAISVSKVKLSRVQEFAIGRAEIGKLGPNKSIQPTAKASAD
ncbi:hypothetical protein ORJ00_14410 [Rheinheimera baltica]|uniref:hypothetical protein n=1 Tax=Rheinheimera baltica TaxID=67576 RepID=UPI00273E1722|nr:hypothetical protein [Rheinheimera baltica]MDP5143937.1 hypothetical protein [Rheinheimera baltica]